MAETSHMWTSTHSDAFDVFYQGTTQTPAFNFTGFFPPVDNPPTINTVKAGSAIPVKFSLGLPPGEAGPGPLLPGPGEARAGNDFTDRNAAVMIWSLLYLARLLLGVGG